MFLLTSGCWLGLQRPTNEQPFCNVPRKLDIDALSGLLSSLCAETQQTTQVHEHNIKLREVLACVTRCRLNLAQVLGHVRFTNHAEGTRTTKSCLLIGSDMLPSNGRREFSGYGSFWFANRTRPCWCAHFASTLHVRRELLTCDTCRHPPLPTQRIGWRSR